jgi:hypothetical protein
MSIGWTNDFLLSLLQPPPKPPHPPPWRQVLLALETQRDSAPPLLVV